MEILKSKRKKRIKNRYKKIIASLIIVTCFIGLSISGYQIFSWKQDSDNTDKQVKEVQEIVEIIETEDTEEVEIIEQVEEIPAPNPYWYYIKMNLINVDFNELKKINN